MGERDRDRERSLQHLFHNLPPNKISTLQVEGGADSFHMEMSKLYQVELCCHDFYSSLFCCFDDLCHLVLGIYLCVSCLGTKYFLTK